MMTQNQIGFSFSFKVAFILDKDLHPFFGLQDRGEKKAKEKEENKAKKKMKAFQKHHLNTDIVNSSDVLLRRFS